MGSLRLVQGRIAMRSFELIYCCGSSHDVLPFGKFVDSEHIRQKIQVSVCNYWTGLPHQSCGRSIFEKGMWPEVGAVEITLIGQW